MKLRVTSAIIFFSLLAGCGENALISEKAKPSLQDEIKLLSDLSASKARLSDEAIVEQNTKVIEMSDDKRETILKQPIPGFTFVFPCKIDSRKICEGESVKVDLPQEGIELVEKCWKKTIEIRYLEVAVENLNYEQMLKLLTMHGEVSLSFQGEILDVKIDSPAGARGISTFEAEQINSLIISFADKTVSEALKKKKGRSQNSV